VATAETLMVLGAMVLLSIVLLSINGALLTNSEVVLEGKVASMAISLAQQVIEEAIPRADVNFESIHADYDGRKDYYRYLIPEQGSVADYTLEQLAAHDSSLADFTVSVGVDTTIGTGMSEMVVTVSSPYLDHDVDLTYVFSCQY